MRDRTEKQLHRCGFETVDHEEVGQLTGLIGSSGIIVVTLSSFQPQVSLTLVSQFRFTKKMYILVSHPHSEIILQTLLHYGDHMFSLKKKKKTQLYWRVPFSEHKIHSFTFLSMLLHMLTEVCGHHYSLIIFFFHQRNFLLTSRRF